MTSEELRDYIEFLRSQDAISYDVYSGLIDGIDTLEQEPKTVLYSGDGYADGEMVYDMAECPNCGRKFEDGDETWNCNFCPECGQALDWGVK